ncbi:MULTISPECIES: hypothetical protein [Bartonella]|nr:MULTISPECIES: hypothetical protein [Bartonella]MBH9995219.1 hypothetical protein [Bartonella sp. P0291]MBI0012992.1 hypothetical protein [Bartonella apihabitans]
MVISREKANPLRRKTKWQIETRIKKREFAIIDIRSLTDLKMKPDRILR